MCYFFKNFTSYTDLYISTYSLASTCQFLFKILIVITLFLFDCIAQLVGSLFPGWGLSSGCQQ